MNKNNHATCGSHQYISSKYYHKEDILRQYEMHPLDDYITYIFIFKGNSILQYPNSIIQYPLFVFSILSLFEELQGFVKAIILLLMFTIISKFSLN